MSVPDPKQVIQAELQPIEEDCIHSGEAHFNACDRWARYHYWLGIPSVVLSALAGAAFFKDHGDIAGIMSATVVRERSHGDADRRHAISSFPILTTVRINCSYSGSRSSRNDIAGKCLPCRLKAET